MSETSIEQVVCKPNNNGKTSITFDRFLADDSFSDDEGKSAESLEDMIGELRENEDSPFDDEKRLHLKKEPSAFLFQRMAQKKLTMSTKQGNKLSSFLNGSAEDESIQIAESNRIPTFPSGFRFSSSVETRKICSACLLLTLPSIISVCIALVVVFLVRENNMDDTSIPISMSPTGPLISPSPAPSRITLTGPAAHGMLNNDDDETSILTITPTVQQQQQQQDVVMDKTLSIESMQQSNSSGTGETLDIITKPQLIGLIDSPMDNDELVLLIETDSDLAVTKHSTPLDISKMKETTKKGGDKLFCNIKVDDVNVSVECRASEETCRVYLEPLLSTLCDQVDDGEISS